MYSMQPKKLLLINILDILRRYTDENHRLSQKEIENILRKEYCMTVDRKSVKANLMNLIDFGYDIEYSESVRMVKNKKTGQMEESYILSDFYLVRDITDSELRLLIDGVLFSKHITYSQCKDLIKKLENLSSTYFKSRVRHIATMSDDRTDNGQLFYNIDILDEAISQNKKVSFKYIEYDTKLKQHPKKTKDGKERIYVVSPYQMAAKEGKYYLICNYDPYNDISNYRLDRITDISMLEEKAKPFKSLTGSNGQPLNLTEYMRDHVYMYSSDSSRVKLRVVNRMISDVVDAFGKNVKFSDKDENHVTVQVSANEQSVLQFAQSFAPDVVILEPQRLRDEITERLRNGLEKYETDNP